MRGAKKLKIKKSLIGIVIVTIVITGGLIWWNTSYPITRIPPSDVSKIDVFDGNTGKSVSITDTTDINHIIKNLNEVYIKKDKISLGYVGYSFRTTIYKTNGDIYKKFIINSRKSIRKDPFFYRDSSESIDYDYIRDLIDKSSK